MTLLNLGKEVHKRSVVNDLIRGSRTNFSYYFLLSLSTLIITLGLTLDSEPVIMGGMLMAPFLRPILAMGLALATVSAKAMARSIIGIFNSLVVVLLISFFASLLMHDPNSLTSQMLTRGVFSELYIWIAIFSGIGATYTLVDPRIESALPGVAVAVSLLPPLCVSGIGLAQKNVLLLTNSLKIFGVNFAGIVLSALVVFFIFRFATLRQHEEKAIIKEESTN